MCSKRLLAAIPLCAAPLYEASFDTLDEPVKLVRTSPASIDRLRKSVRAQHPKGLGGPKPATLLKNEIHIRTAHWGITLPDSWRQIRWPIWGNSPAGNFVWR